MYPPRRSGDSISKPKTGYVPGTYSSPSHKDTSKVNKILENAKKYQQAKEYKRDYLLEGIMNLKKKPGEEENGSTKRRRQSQASSNSDKADDKKKDIYRRVDAYDAGFQQSLHESNLPKKETNFVGDQTTREIKRGSTGIYQKTETLANLQNDQYQKKDYAQAQSPQTRTSQLNRYSSSNLLRYQEFDKNGSQSAVKNSTQTQYKPNENNYQYQFQQQVAVPSGQQNLTNKQRDITTSMLPQTKNQQNTLINNNIPNSTSSQLTKQEKHISRVVSQSQFNRRGLQNQFVSGQTLASKTEYQISALKDRESQRPIHSNQQTGASQIGGNRQLNFENSKAQPLIKKKEELLETENEQKNYIKLQMDNLTKQAIQMRDKYYKGEQERAMIKQKNRLLESENKAVRSENQQLKFKLKNVEFEFHSLHSSNQLIENQLKQLKNNRQSVYDDLMGKMNELNLELRKKSLEITNLERTCSQLENKINENNYEIRRLNQAVSKKEEEVLLLQQKIYQFNKLNSAQTKTDSEIKKYAQKISMLEAENNELRHQKGLSFQREEELNKYRKEFKEMVQKIKDIEAQLETKDRIIAEYKSIPSRGYENQSIKMIELELESVMKQKTEIVNSYEQKILQKDKIISQLQIKMHQFNSKQSKLIGLESGEASFEQILRGQLEEINMLKRENTDRINEVFRLKLEMENLRSELQNEANKNKLLSMQAQSNERNSNSMTESHLRGAKNQIELLQRRILNLNNTIESKRKQNQNKDEFIRQYLLGASKQTDAEVILGKLEILLSQK